MDRHRERDLADSLGLRHRELSEAEALQLEPSLAPVFDHAVHWPDAASVSNPLAVTKAYAAQFVLLGGVMLNGDARTLHRSGDNWRVDTDEGPVDAGQAVIALGPWAPDLLAALGIRLPMAVKRGYHRHFRPRQGATLARPVLDADNGFCLTAMANGAKLEDATKSALGLTFDELDKKWRASIARRW